MTVSGWDPEKKYPKGLVKLHVHALKLILSYWAIMMEATVQCNWKLS